MKKCKERRLGKPLFIAEPVKVRNLGPSVCPVCGGVSDLLERKGYGFRAVFSMCRENRHQCETEKELYQKFEVGDIVRVYESSFGKDAVLRLHSFYEGPIVKVYPFITDYDFDFMVEKAVFRGKELPSHSWVYGHVIRGHASHSRAVRLIRRAEQTKDKEGADEIRGIEA